MAVNWKNKRVLVAGGAGMIGSHIAKELVKRGADVTVADNLSSGSLKNIESIRKDAMFLKFDLRDKNKCVQAIRGMDAVFQFAADMGGIGYITSHHAPLLLSNTLINLNMLVVSKDAGVGNYFYSSSACVYPNYKQTEAAVPGLKENDAYPADCNEVYGWEKLYAEIMAQSFCKDYGMNIHIARFHNVYGEMYTCFDKDKGKAPCHLILKAIKHPDPPMTIWGKGDATRSFLYVDDCVEGVLKLVDSDYHDPLNIGSDRLISVDDLARLIIRISDKKIGLEHDLTKPEGVKGRNSDNTLVRQILGWEPKVSLEDGLSRVYRWAEQHYSELEGI